MKTQHVFPCISVLLCCIVTISSGSFHQGHVSLRPGRVAEYVAGEWNPASEWQAAATGTYNASLMSTGWGVLNIHVGYGNASMSDEDLMYAAGYLEGAFTAQEIHDHYQNVKAIFFKNKKADVIEKVRDFLAKQVEWARKMSNQFKGSDPLWRHVAYVIAQLDGLHDGYKTFAKPDWETDIFVVQMLNAVGDLIDLMHALDPQGRPDYHKMSPPVLQQYVSMHGHCSALVKVMGAYEDIFMGHSSWFSYSATLRIYKHYDFNLKDPMTAAKKISFSSYPGFLESLDDFYTLSSGLVMLQTTNNVFNMSLYDLVHPQTLLAWQRVRVANHMARSGADWFNIMKQYNSGTYNNQYMVIDLSKVKLGEVVEDGALWVVEQIPGLVAGGDQSSVLRTGYWPSYNVPFYEDVYNRSGYPDFVKQHGLDYSYQLAPRAKIFRRDQATVVDMSSFQHIMRYNDYSHDKYSEGNPCNSICCRGDLDKKSPIANGCYDSKVTDYKMAMEMRSLAINGPTRSSGLEPFQWTGSFTNISHVGLPKTYDFSWQPMQPEL